MISETRLNKALKYLAETDEDAARAKALMISLEDQRKTVKALAFLKAQGTVAEREANAYNSQEYRDHAEKLENAVADYEALRNKRATETIIIEVWRSLNAARRSGQIV